MASTETNGTMLDVPIWNTREPDRVVLDTAKTLTPYCSLQHLVKSDIIDALNNKVGISGAYPISYFPHLIGFYFGLRFYVYIMTGRISLPLLGFDCSDLPCKQKNG